MTTASPLDSVSRPRWAPTSSVRPSSRRLTTLVRRLDAMASGSGWDAIRVGTYRPVPPIPFLGKLFYEFRHPDRLAELGLSPHLDRAAATLNRVDRGVFFAGFTSAGMQTPEDNEPHAATAITYFYTALPRGVQP